MLLFTILLWFIWSGETGFIVNNNQCCCEGGPGMSNYCSQKFKFISLPKKCSEKSAWKKNFRNKSPRTLFPFLRFFSKGTCENSDLFFQIFIFRFFSETFFPVTFLHRFGLNRYTSLSNVNKGFVRRRRVKLHEKN